ncbi:MAG: beta-ketoacyl-[acyl-carrier-protein] synthase family protein [Thermoanaerobaculia bacterium]|jgi:3-oxoacyl-[acyl-carrier-protein] synthase II|nr:beta-ketoacyl-[acyl-carrier-protein] synthase family protein [Thermoanaerobaculia bacterium]
MRRRVAVTGLGCVTPLGTGAGAFLEGLRAGRSGVRRISLFDPSDLPVRIAAEASGFDPADHVGAKDARHVSRVVPMAIAAAAEALASAGIEAEALPLDERRRIAVLLGSGGGPVEFFERMYGHWYRGELKKASVYAIPTGTIGTLSSEVSMRFGLKGPSHVVSTGCTSSADAIGYAAKAIRYGERDVVLAGGADAVITPGIMTGFGLMQILASSRQEAPETASRPFDAGRDGFVLGEGSWFFVLEEMEHARARGARLLGEVAGWGSTCDAYHRVRLDESGVEPARAMTEALEDAGLDVRDVGYVQYHGTGTELNDRIETRATRLALGAAAERVPGSSVKSQIGHPQGASGAAGLAATLLALNAGFLPPTANLDTPGPECDLDYVPRDSRPAEVGVALVNGIAFGSKNSALAVRTARALPG